MILGKTAIRKKYFILFIFGCLTHTFVLYYVNFAKPYVLFRRIVRKVRNINLEEVELFQSYVHHIHPVARVGESGNAVWEINLFEPLHKKHK